jgi:hypothetical protein
MPVPCGLDRAPISHEIEDSNQLMKTIGLLVYFSVLAWSVIAPHDYFTCFLEAAAIPLIECRSKLPKNHG